MKFSHTFLIACLGAASVHAQQAEPKADAPKPAAAAPSDESGAERRSDKPQPEQKPVAYLGLLTRDVPAELRTQFSLAEGFGLLVDEVMPDTPAKAAGLKQHDVLVKFEDQQLVNMDQLMSLVRAKKKGDVVHLDVITGGKETQVAVTLGERLAATHDHHANGMHPFHGESQRGGFQHHQGNAPHDSFDRLRKLQQELREYQQRVQEWAKGNHTGPMPQAPSFNLPGPGHGYDSGQPLPHGRGRRHNGHAPQTGISIPPGTNVQQFQSHVTANTTRLDDSGEYTVKTEDGQKTFTVRPPNGPEKSWPINNDAERQAVPQKFRDKLQRMDGASSSIRIEINPGAADKPPTSPPPAIKKTTSA